MLMRVNTLDTIEGVPIILYSSLADDEMVKFTAGMRIDSDGSGGNIYNDPYYQKTTSLTRGGEYLNAQVEPFIVVPPIVCQKTKGIVLGSLVLFENTLSLAFGFGVVGDIGPHSRIGEGSSKAATIVGLSGDANHGGTDSHSIRYTIFVGVPAVIGQFKYTLKPYR